MDRAHFPFVKMHGLGNDYIYLDEREVEIPDPSPWAAMLSDQHRGIGADGLIVLRRDREFPVRMEMFNADGSRSGMCGNGLRCVARLARERAYATSDQFEIAVDGGRCPVKIIRDGDEIVAVSVALGVPTIAPQPLNISWESGELEGISVEIGNPHFVHHVERDLMKFPLDSVGPAVEHHPAFPNRTNVGIAQVIDRQRIDLRVWERGAGETQACGSGAAAAVAALHACGKVDNDVLVKVLGGFLTIDIDGDLRTWMTGPALESFRGVFDLDGLLRSQEEAEAEPTLENRST